MRSPDRYDHVPFQLDRIHGLVSPGDSLPKVLRSLGSAGLDERIAAPLLAVTVEVFREVLDEFEELQAAWEQGQAEADTMVTYALYQKATKGDLQAQKFWLTNRLPEVWTLYGKNTSGAARENGGRPKNDADPLTALKLIG